MYQILLFRFDFVDSFSGCLLAVHSHGRKNMFTLAVFTPLLNIKSEYNGFGIVPSLKSSTQTELRLTSTLKSVTCLPLNIGL